MIALIERFFSKVRQNGKPGEVNSRGELHESMRDHLRSEFRLSVTDMLPLRQVGQRGRFAGMPVKFIRIFDHTKACECGARIESYRDLDSHPELVFFDGHIFESGTVCLNRKQAG
ncbi:hypothetical protein ACFLYG_01875 [Chloroflexota bacterium]